MGGSGGQDPRIAQVAEWLVAHSPSPPRVGIILGSGLGTLADLAENAIRVPYTDCAALPQPTVPGHAGTLVCGHIAGRSCAILQGRYHHYEGWDPATVALPARALIRARVRELIVTNSAGAINRRFRAGDLMLIDDHINLQWRNPLIGAVQPAETRFPDMSAPYDRELMRIAEAVALEERIRVARGVYCALLGPSYETPAEIRMLERLGADAVGMSTVPETLVARAAGVRVLGVSVITNPAPGLAEEPLRHEDVIEQGRRSAASLARLLSGVIRQSGE